MEWTNVESSQIAEVGYDAETQTLGIRFHPTKKQKETQQPGSEYHYANVTVEIYSELITAESVGSYFGKNIKPFPDKYPFTKIEPEAV